VIAGASGCGGEEQGDSRAPPSRRRRRHGTLDTVLPIAQAGDSVVRRLRTAAYPLEYRRFRGGHEASTATSSAAIRWLLTCAG